MTALISVNIHIYSSSYPKTRRNVDFVSMSYYVLQNVFKFNNHSNKQGYVFLSINVLTFHKGQS